MGHHYYGNLPNSYWVAAQDVEVGHRLIDEHGNHQTVLSVTTLPVPLDSYNLEVDTDHSFFVRGFKAVDLDDANSTHNNIANDAAAIWVHNKNCWYDLSDDFDSQIINNRTVYNFEANGKQVNVITNPDWRPDTKLPRYIEVELYQTAGNKTDFRIIDENKPNIHYNRATNNPSVAVAKDEKNQRFVSNPNKKVVAPDADKYKWIDKHRHPDPNVQSGFGISKPITNSTYFTTQTEWQAPGKGTGLKYTVYQQDIDLNARPFISDGDMRTNAELMQKGNAPYILKNGKYEQVQLHHSQQDGRGSLFELTEASHQTNHKSGGAALHPYSPEKHPDYAKHDGMFRIDQSRYWKDRIKHLKSKEVN